MRTILVIALVSVWASQPQSKFVAHTADRVQWLAAPDLSKGATTALEYGNPQPGPQVVR